MKRLIVVFIVAVLIIGTAWAYKAYEDYNAADAFATRIHLIPHDVDKIVGETTKQHIVNFEFQVFLSRLNTKLAKAERQAQRCAEIQAELSPEADPDFRQAVLQQRGCAQPE